MPVHLEGSKKPESLFINTKDQNFDNLYEEAYGGLDLRPNSALHDRLRDEIMTRAHDSARVMKDRHPIWRKIDWTLTSYIQLDDNEVKSFEKDPRKPVSIVFPISYENKEVLLTYLVIAFLDNPIFKYEGAGAGAKREAKAILMERVVSLQTRRSKAAAELHTVFSDSLAYGFGVAHVTWKKVLGKRTRTVDQVAESIVLDEPIVEEEAGTAADHVIFEGNALEALDPYKVLPDPDVPIHQVDRMEYFGWIERTSLASLLKVEKASEHIFNCLYLKKMGKCVSRVYSQSDTGRDMRTGGSDEPKGTLNKIVDIVWKYIDIIPKDWELGEEEYPETWLFGIAADRLLIAARPTNLDHGKKPIAVSAPTTDGHSVSPTSAMEVIYGLQTTADFFFNTRSMNVKKALNDMWVVDPEVINIRSLKNRGPGKIIYLKRSMWGEGKIDSAIRQFPVADVTGNLPADIDFVRDASRSASGSVDALMGVRRRGGERVSATEAQATQQAALSRMERMARLTDVHFMFDVGTMMASNTRQFMSETEYVKVVGRLEETLKSELSFEGGIYKVEPQEFDDAFFDVIPNDGTIPGNGNAQIWERLFQTIAQNEQITGEFDVVRIFKHVARIAGARNLEEFVRRNGTAPTLRAEGRSDEEIINGVENGSLTPVGGTNANGI